MSGAEAAIAGVGFLCNAMQIVTFGRDFLQVYRQVRDKSSPDPKLEAYLKSAKACFDDMNSSALATSQVLPLTRDQQQMFDIGKKLEESMAQLQSKFSKLHIDDASRRGFRGKIEIGKRSLASLWQGKELESLEVNLKKYESLLHGVVLHRICNQSQAAEISSQQSFNELNTNLQSAITQLADGRTWMSELSIESLETRNRITQEHETTRTAINTGFTTTHGALLSFRDSVSQEFQDMARRDQSKTFEQEHNQLLQSLRFSEMNSRRNHISENYPGTFNWVFKNPIHCSVQQREEKTDGDEDMIDSSESVNTARLSDLNRFPAWLESDARQFWISGKPASGKSSLMKFLATHPLTLQHLQAQHSNMQILTHYFWKPGQPLQKNIEGMARSLLHQVLHKNRLLAQQLWTEQSDVQDKRDGGDWDVNELKKALCWAIEFSGNDFCIFLDGLDEAKDFEDLPYGDNKNTQVIYDLLSFDNVKLCASSREENPFCRFFAGQPHLRTHQLNENDIYHYAENRLEVSGLSSEDQSRLLKIVVWKANGVFLWVVLAIKSLNQAIRSGGANEFEERLAKTPSDLHDLLVDMWNRPGDDVELSTYSIEASRFFSLALAAIKIDIYSYWRNPPPLHSMRSLLAMATALEDKPFIDKPFISILREGREIQEEELQARCSKVEDRLRLVCRGLLEVTTLEDVRYEWAGNEVLFNYAMTRVEFIHRCAFDFITDTQFGRECLALCHWSSTEQVERLLAGHIVKSRFLCYEPTEYPRIMTQSGERFAEFAIDKHQLAPALHIAFNWSDSNISFRNSLCKELRDWQQHGLFSDHIYWEYPISTEVPTNLKDLEFLEVAVSVAKSDVVIIELIDQLSIVRLADAIPVLLRALVDEDGEIAMGSCWGFVDYILTRLQSATGKEGRDASSQVQHDVKNATRLLHSWFVMQCLYRLEVEWHDDWDEITDLLHRFSRTLSSMSDWQSPLFLKFVGYSGYCQIRDVEDSFQHYTFAIGNFVTAYRMLGQLLGDAIQDEMVYALQPPQDAEDRFDVLLIEGNADHLGNDRKFFSPATEYHLDIANCIKESLSSRHLCFIEQRWAVLFRDISTGLQWVGQYPFEYCIKELNKRDLELIHPWANVVIDS
ncbi:small s [Fusarium acutatum]|uniref:Small s n=1 Tax=Fusarium acutatum TaxID=78861 RepID=A0A8H4JL00_9HYPO|nr:small s [Fusarium acutatum]